MMDRNPINSIKIILISLFVLSCNKMEEQKVFQNFSSLEEITYSYIDMFNQKHYKERNFLLKVKVDSSFAEYNLYRMYMSLSLLRKNEFPNKVYIHDEIKVAHFIKAQKNDSTFIKIKSTLEKEGLYKQDSFLISSHYPEWIVLEDRLKGDFFVFKDSKSEINH